jgi:hypothetical protein
MFIATASGEDALQRSAMFVCSWDMSLLWSD